MPATANGKSQARKLVWDIHAVACRGLVKLAGVLDVLLYSVCVSCLCCHLQCAAAAPFVLSSGLVCFVCGGFVCGGFVLFVCVQAHLFVLMSPFSACESCQTGCVQLCHQFIGLELV